MMTTKKQKAYNKLLPITCVCFMQMCHDDTIYLHHYSTSVADLKVLNWHRCIFYTLFYRFKPMSNLHVQIGGYNYVQ